MPKWKSNGSYEPCPEGTHVPRPVSRCWISAPRRRNMETSPRLSSASSWPRIGTGRRYFRWRATSTLHAKSTTRGFIESMPWAASSPITSLAGTTGSCSAPAVRSRSVMWSRTGRSSTISSTSRGHEGGEVPGTKAAAHLPSLDREQFDEKVFEDLATWLKDKITSSPEYAEMLEPPPPPPPKPSIHEELNDQIPF